jgi:hypothetical protein
MLKKTIIVCICLLKIGYLSAQSTIPETTSFLIEGLIEKEVLINIDSLRHYPTILLDSVVILNHKGEIKSTMRQLSVIPIKALMQQIKIKTESPKQLSEFYFVFEASDGYKVVYSWNEIFNTKNGGAVYIIMEKAGVKERALDDFIAIITPNDLMTGRRYIKSLKKITVKRVN